MVRKPTRAVPEVILPLLIAFLACASTAFGRNGELPIAAESNRPWVGQHFFANRLQDWRLQNGRIECIESAARFPFRTVNVLTRSIGSDGGTFQLSVDVSLGSGRSAAHEQALAGLLLGHGNEGVDYRISALVHHKPAEDGGMLAVIDHLGRVSFRSFSTPPAKGGNIWSVSGPVPLDDVPVLDGMEQTGSGFGGASFESVRLIVDGVLHEDGTNELRVRAESHITGNIISEATLANVDSSLIDGAISLVSHRGSADDGRAFGFESIGCTGSAVQNHDERTFGPIVSTMYTLSDGVLNLTAQMMPLGEIETGDVTLAIQDPDDGHWRPIASAPIQPDAWIAEFQVPEWGSQTEVHYRVQPPSLAGIGSPWETSFEGTIRAAPVDAPEFTLAAFTGQKTYTGVLKWNSNGIWFPHNDIVSALRVHDPDFLFFSGDQIYEGDLTPADTRTIEKLTLDYLYRWYRHCWSFRDLMREIPTVTIPDDHDVYHGNIWGAANIRAPKDERFKNAQDRGGYKHPARFVNAVHATQVSHLPEPADPEPIHGGISVYTTRIEYGGMSFAVLADRMFKSAPAAVIAEEAAIYNGWSQTGNFTPEMADVDGAELLGSRQERFLNEWATDWSRDAWMKVALSQTIFANVATLPEGAMNGGVLPSLSTPEPGEYPANYKLAMDCDSNAWPQTPRKRAVRALRRGLALHVAGDQHLASTIQYGVDRWRDAPYAVCVPSIANAWPRRWFPPEPGLNRDPEAPRYTGDYLDGFDNHMTVLAVANPVRTGVEPARLHDQTPGYGIVRFDRDSRDIEIACWPRHVDPLDPEAKPYAGWPVRLNQLDNLGAASAAIAWLPTIEVGEAHTRDVIRVINEATNEVEYAWRLNDTTTFTPRAFSLDATYTIAVGDPDQDEWMSASNLEPRSDRDPPRILRLHE